MIEPAQAFWLALVQGVTEFLPGRESIAQRCEEDVRWFVIRFDNQRSQHVQTNDDLAVCRRHERVDLFGNH